VAEYLANCDDDYKIMVLPDHPTPIEIRTHSPEPVPFFIYSSKSISNGINTFDEYETENTNLYLPDGFELLDYMINKVD